MSKKSSLLLRNSYRGTKNLDTLPFTGSYYVITMRLVCDNYVIQEPSL